MSDGQETNLPAAGSPSSSSADEPTAAVDHVGRLTKSPRKSRTTKRRNYPVGSFSQCLDIGQAIFRLASGTRVRLLTLLETMRRNPDSSATRQLLVNSAKYGVTREDGDYIELTNMGRLVVDPGSDISQRLQAEFELAIHSHHPFLQLYDRYVGKPLPNSQFMRDFLREIDEPISDYAECVDLFVVNLKHVGLLRVIGGAERLISIEKLVEDRVRDSSVELASDMRQDGRLESFEVDTAQRGQDHDDFGASQFPLRSSVDVSVPGRWDTVCFYVTAIGDEGSESRKHSDLFFSQIVAPAVMELELSLVRADKIGQAGMITAQILEHIKRSKLVIADMSFLNPNAFYEIALRHALKLPIVHIIRKADRIPFDINQMRCVIIDNTDIYSLVPNIQTYQSEIATQARSAIEDPENVGNPISVFYPRFWEA